MNATKPTGQAAPVSVDDRRSTHSPTFDDLLRCPALRDAILRAERSHRGQRVEFVLDAELDDSTVYVILDHLLGLGARWVYDVATVASVHVAVSFLRSRVSDYSTLIVWALDDPQITLQRIEREVRP